MFDVYGPLQIFPGRVYGLSNKLYLRIERDTYEFSPFLFNNSYGIYNLHKDIVVDDCSANFPTKTSGILFSGEVLHRIYRYDHDRLMSEFQRRARKQRLLFPLPNASLYGYYGAGYMVYANTEAGYTMMAHDVLHVFTKRQGNFLAPLYPYPNRETYYMDDAGRLVTYMPEAIQRIQQLDVGIFADPFVWALYKGGRKTSVFEGIPMLPREVTNNE